MQVFRDGDLQINCASFIARSANFTLLFFVQKSAFYVRLSIAIIIESKHGQGNKKEATPKGDLPLPPTCCASQTL